MVSRRTLGTAGTAQGDERAPDPVRARGGVDALRVLKTGWVRDIPAVQPRLHGLQVQTHRLGLDIFVRKDAKVWRRLQGCSLVPTCRVSDPKLPAFVYGSVGFRIPLKISHYIMGGAQVLFLYVFYRDFWGLMRPFYIQRFLYFVL